MDSLVSRVCHWTPRHMFSSSICECIEPLTPIRSNYYRCDKRFHTDILEYIMNKTYMSCITLGIVSVTGSSSTLYKVSRNTATCVWSDDVRRQNSTRRGGQSAARIQRIRDMDVHIWEQTISAHVQKNHKLFDGVLVVGNGPLFQRFSCAQMVDKIGFNKFTNESEISVCLLIKWFKQFETILQKKVELNIMKRLKRFVQLSPEKLIYGLQELTVLSTQSNVKRLVVHQTMVDTFTGLMETCEKVGATVRVVSDPWILDFGGIMGIKYY